MRMIQKQSHHDNIAIGSSIIIIGYSMASLIAS
eukprot:SAG11_NODE_295_length_11115_cov_14.005264_9_plen_33_part_00